MSFPVADGLELVTLPPPGQAFNPLDPQRHGDVAVYAVLGVGTLLASAFLAMRLYTCSCITKRIVAEDYLMLAAFGVDLALQALAVWLFAVGAGGVHIWEMPLDTFNKWMLVCLCTPGRKYPVIMLTGGDLGQNSWIFTSIYIFCATFVKLSLLVFFLRVERSSSAWFRATVVVTMCLMVCYTLGMFFLSVFSCQPIRKSFDVRVREGQCINQAILHISNAIWNLATDATVLLLAFHLVKCSRLPRLEKQGIAAFLSILGLLVLIASIMRAVYLFPALHSVDITWDVPTIVTWSIAKANLNVICGCLPPLRTFLHQLTPRRGAQKEEEKHSSQTWAGTVRVFPPRSRGRLAWAWPRDLLDCSVKVSGKLCSRGAQVPGVMSTRSSRKDLYSGHDTPMRSQNETDWTTTFNDVEEDPVDRIVHQQAIRDYHSHLYQNWWDQA